MPSGMRQSPLASRLSATPRCIATTLNTTVSSAETSSTIRSWKNGAAYVVAIWGGWLIRCSCCCLNGINQGFSRPLVNQSRQRRFCRRLPINRGCRYSWAAPLLHAALADKAFGVAHCTTTRVSVWHIDSCRPPFFNLSHTHTRDRSVNDCAS